MTDELQEILYTRYPKLFAQRKLPMSQTCICWGVCCGKGWFKLLAQMCDELQTWSDVTGEQVEFTQIKEKFGTLRVYLAGGCDAVYAIIAKATDASAVTCELCGKPGKLRDDCGWLTTLCTRCWFKAWVRKTASNIWYTIKWRYLQLKEKFK